MINSARTQGGGKLKAPAFINFHKLYVAYKQGI